ncbi:deubiquitinating enzyme [Boothiomyces macroporosus]|uniref:Ubiquitin carboxyl-terminal hydrolase n=1 Tax=Boothiomyces macroporosus TaxID=261099 RepID=A0AAD5UHH1_9FUNG|nr:deubiquitinating enzyme [Boothiomyces macroporosus]
MNSTLLLILVIIKWNGEKYNVPVDLSQPGLVLKTQIFSLTGVAPERQKIMVKGGVLKDDTDLNTLKLKENQQLMMMGTVEALKEPQEKPVFLEDLSEAQISKALNIPAGLVNLGNTCYLNSTLQCLRAVTELPTAVEKTGINISSNNQQNFSVSMNALFKELDKSGQAVHPVMFVQLLRTLYPQFAERDRNGFMQQDAEECWGQIVHVLDETVNGLTRNGESNKSKKFVEQFMTVETIVETKCDDAPAEPPSVSMETTNKLRVNIGAVSTYMVSEIGNGLIEKIEKNSPTLGRNAIFTKTSKISRLPRYLTINFVRFQWKAQEQIKAKILKRVQFPFELDMVPFCTPELTAKLQPAKQRLKEIADRKADEKIENAQEMAVDEAPKDQKALLEAIGVDSSLIEDPGVNPSGQYDLVAVLTHVGRGANSGHYIGWVKQGGHWWKFDDDKVSQIKEEDITKLEGGGDWHTAYMCLYKSRDLE